MLRHARRDAARRRCRTGNLVVNPGAEALDATAGRPRANFTALPVQRRPRVPDAGAERELGRRRQLLRRRPGDPGERGDPERRRRRRGARDRRRARDARALGADRRLRGPGGRGDRDRDGGRRQRQPARRHRRWPRRPTADRRAQTTLLRALGDRAGPARDAHDRGPARVGPRRRQLQRRLRRQRQPARCTSRRSTSPERRSAARSVSDGEHAHRRGRDPARRDDRRPPRRRRAHDAGRDRALLRRRLRPAPPHRVAACPAARRSGSTGRPGSSAATARPPRAAAGRSATPAQAPSRASPAAPRECATPSVAAPSPSAPAIAIAATSDVDDDLAHGARLDRVVGGGGVREREAVQRQCGQRARLDRLGTRRPRACSAGSGIV